MPSDMAGAPTTPISSATSLNANRTIQGMKIAPLRDDVLDHWRSEVARTDNDGS